MEGADRDTTTDDQHARGLVVEACTLLDRLEGIRWNAGEEEIGEVLAIHEQLCSTAGGLPDGPLLDDVCGVLAQLDEAVDALLNPPERRLAS